MNYAQLKAAIAGRLGRTNLTSVIPDFISLGEPRLYLGFKDIDVQVAPLRIRAMLAKATDTLATLPDGFVAVDRLTVGSSYQPLQFLPPEEFAKAWAGSGAVSRPLYYTLRDGGIAVQGGTPTTFALSYYKRFASLAADTDTNWLLTNSPNLYLYSALIEAYAHLKDDARIPTAARMYAAAANALIDADVAERHSGSTLIMGNPR